MSHQGSDFLTEAVMNSIEASATRIEIECTVFPDSVDMTVKDDGEGLQCDDAFGDGVSTKGQGRGKGLYLLKKAAREASIRDTGSGTLLTFRIDKGNMGSLSDVLPYVFSFADTGVSVRFTIIRGDEVLTLDSGALKSEFGELSRVRALAGVKKRSRRADELLEES